jgi:putative ATPase
MILSDSLPLFFSKNAKYQPLAERVRPGNLDEVIGHDKFLNARSPLRQQLQNDMLPSLILWGPPGVGKTTIARLLAKAANRNLSSLSAVTSGIKELRHIIEHARLTDPGHVLFIDEIHRYNKAQQDGLLHAVEDGTIIFIGATTENPSFEVIPPLLSRCQVWQLQPLSVEELAKIVKQALGKDAMLSKIKFNLSGMEKLLQLGSGDARRTLNLLEICTSLVPITAKNPIITEQLVERAADQNALLFDKKGDYHFDTISAFIKSVRGSDPDAAVYYLARMLAGGEDPLFIARRLIILAAEDIGNAEPYALSLANACFQAVHVIGMPEARIILSQTTTYLASCPKSNAAYLAIDQAWHDVKENPTLQIPKKLRNAPTSLMKQEGYGQGYKYPHDYPDHFIGETYLPDKIKETVYYRPTEMGREKALKERLQQLWKKYKNK